MEHRTNNCRILWDQTPQHSARVLRIYGSTPSVIIPAFINGYPVTELGSYCFAKDCRLPKQYHTYDASYDSSTAIRELCGDYIEEAFLPDSLKKIHDYAFYNCRNLKQLSFGCGLTGIGSDAFMNCHQLHQLYVNCPASDKTGLRQILAQISWDVEVSFCSSPVSGDAGVKAPIIAASIFYPEFYEAYDEIAPAHIFGRHIIGEGFRARQAFRDGVIDFAQYDEIFKKASTEESVQTMCRILLCRLQYPIGLAPAKKSQYENYIQSNGHMLSQCLVKDRQLESLLFLVRHKLLLRQDIQSAIESAAQSGWVEGSASLMRDTVKHSRSGPKSRYLFDDF